MFLDYLNVRMGHFSGEEHNRFVDFGAGIDSPDHVLVRAELKAM